MCRAKTKKTKSETGMSIKLQLPNVTELKPRITVIGVGGAGGNAVENMIAANLQGVEFVVANTDAQALAGSSAEHRIQLGVNLTEGLGAGSRPEIGEAAAEEAIDEIRNQLSGSHMVFVAAGMGGGTGTGAAKVVARVSQELGILTVGVVSKPFHFEGNRRMRTAEAGIAELAKHVDTLIVIPNQNLFRIANERTTFEEAFLLADQVLHAGISCITDLMVREGLINLDFADVRAIMMNMGTAMMGTGEAEGERRAIEAAELAISNPLLDEVTLKGAKGLLISISGTREMTLYEVNEAASRIREEVDADANIILGASFDETLGSKIRVSIVASGLEASAAAASMGVPPGRAAPLPGDGALGRAILEAPPAGEQVASAEAGGPSPDSESAREPAETVALSEQLAAAIGPEKSKLEAEDDSGEEGQWQSEDDVTIELGPPQLLPEEAQLMSPSSAEAGKTDPAPINEAEPFAPAPPEAIEPAPVQIPELDAFPPVAQREYRAKTGEAAPDPEPPVRKKRASLFERLAARMSGAAEAQSKQEMPPKPRQAPNPGEADPGQPTHSHGQEIQRTTDGARVRGSETPGSDGPDESHPQDVEIPQFFHDGRGR